MSKSVQAKANKRNARAKVKRAAVAKGRAAPQAIKQRKMRNLIGQGSKIPNFDAALESAVFDMKKGKAVESEFKDTSDMIAGIKKAVGEVFKLYCYVTLADYLIKAKAIDHELSVPLDDISRVLMNFDSRIGVIEFMNQNPDPEDEIAIQTEAFDIGTNLAQISEDLYQEVARLETFGPLMEETIGRLANEVPAEVTDAGARYTQALQAVAYDYLHRLTLADHEQAQATSDAAETEQDKETEQLEVLDMMSRESAEGETAE